MGGRSYDAQSNDVVGMSVRRGTSTPSHPPLGAGGDLRRRLALHHLPLALASFTALLLWMSLPPFQTAGHQGPPPGAGQPGPPHAAADHQGSTHGGTHLGPPDADGRAASPDHGGELGEGFDLLSHRRLLARVTTATGYIALGLLALTLLIGPANLLLGRRNPVSNYLRRDVGAWTALVSVVHVIVGLQVHGPPAPFAERITHYFFAAEGGLLTNSFGLGNWTGLAATLIAVGLLALSSDAALRKLKAGPWKWIQRLNYALFALVFAHAVYYGALTRVASASTIVLGLSVAAVLVGQTAGIWLFRRRFSRSETT
jgi:sulfoxide reductase heme-binding subunit YedZ